ncbi:hypothetical protein [Pseudomonas putida]|uniref:hypothetical protein n=1 Tax=Pseudomonas putida TaxID=303 RepID=UPI00235C48DD|nr:hypothetical protein [Pseudomonas putida]MDZ5111508.1 hypothetical protein [Pseudomonas putida]GLO38425.1 hypothetical protein PPUN15366_00690 [Pseudomonas putida]HDS0973464.1 hypothetical protein [Pseudomonas putida]
MSDSETTRQRTFAGLLQRGYVDHALLVKMLDQQAGMMSSPSNMKDMPMQRSMELPAPKPVQ